MMIEKSEVRKILNEYLKNIRTRKQLVRENHEQLLDSCSTPLLQQITKNSPEYQTLKAKSLLYSEIIDDIFELIEKFEDKPDVLWTTRKEN